MATNLNTILSWFKTGLKPTQAQFWASWQSFWHKDELIPQSNIADLISTLNAKAEKSQLEGHNHDPEAHSESIGEKLDKGGYAGTAKDIDERIAAIENPDRVLKFGTINIAGLAITIEANAFAWVLNKAAYLTPDAFTETIPAATAGMYRNDILIGNQFGQYSIIEGIEAANGEAAAEPAVPSGTIKLGFISVFGTAIAGSGSTPSIEKTTMVDADRIVIDDSADSFSKKSVKWVSIKANLKAWFDTLYKSWILGINIQSGITYTLGLNDYNKRIVFTNSNPVAFTIPTNASLAIPIGSKFEFTQKGNGVVTLGGAGINFTTNLQLVMVKGETRTITKIGTDEWTVEGFNIPKRTFSVVFSWTGTYVGSITDYAPNREGGHFNNPVFDTSVNYGNLLYMPFKCKIKAVVHGGNALGTPVSLKINKRLGSSGFETIASKTVGPYSNGSTPYVFSYGTDIDSTKIIDAGGSIMITFNNNNVSTGVWRTPSLLIYFEEEF
ncbi:hypothetical protein GON26_20605 [Flavobacterium sp. GA093]|uniref:Uncharacterized protein n=1 Tax=Flavobacterium hydrocarbonoxydans TaxID=2683249 RepID=A0A6I4NRB8_9FLAO|nr:hypothetical protein [Flavobacterium hydrocarbonoxydans]MWB96770.1 hypothetical protein [Flavobacterium hydrocarbonoxydans]